jgi:hypothetical protein
MLLVVPCAGAETGTKRRRETTFACADQAQAPSLLLTITERVKVYNARLALILFYNARPVLNARNYHKKNNA